MSIDQSIINITEENVEGAKPISFKLLLKPEGRISQLWSDSPDQGPISGTARLHEFSFRIPVLISRLEIKCEGYASYDEFEVSWQSSTETNHKEKVKPIDDRIIMQIDETITKFAFRPPAKLLPGKKILSVSAEGFEQEEISRLLKSYGNITTWKQEALDDANKAKASLTEALQKTTEATEKRDEIAGEIKEVLNELRIAQGELASINAQREQARADLKERESSLSKQNSRAEEMESQRKIKQDALSALEKSISENEARLKGLRSDISIFPTELSSFSKQGKATATVYGWLSLIPMAVISFMSINLVQGASTFIDSAWENHHPTFSAH